MGQHAGQLRSLRDVGDSAHGVEVFSGESHCWLILSFAISCCISIFIDGDKFAYAFAIAIQCALETRLLGFRAISCDL